MKHYQICNYKINRKIPSLNSISLIFFNSLILIGSAQTNKSLSSACAFFAYAVEFVSKLPQLSSPLVLGGDLTPIQCFLFAFVTKSKIHVSSLRSLLPL